MTSVDQPTDRLGFWATILVSVFAWVPSMYPGYWQALEGFVPVFNAAHSSAIANIATAPDLWRGTGRGAYLVTQPLMVLGFSPTAAVRATFALSILFGGLGIYVWLRARFGDRVAGLAGIAYMFFPPFLATIYIRGSLSDALIMGLLPLTLAGIAIYVQSRTPTSAAIVVLSLLWIWRIQAGLAVFVTILLLGYAWFAEKSPMATVVVAVSGIAGLVSLIPLWTITAPPLIPFAEHFVYLFQLFYGQWQVAPSIPGWQDAYPFQLGFAMLVLGIILIWLWRTNAKQWHGTVMNRMLWFGVASSAILIFLSLNASAPLWRFSAADRLLTYPWQILLLTAPFLAFLVGILPALHIPLRQPLFWTSLVALTLLASFPYLTTDFTQIEPPRRPEAVIGANNQLVLLSSQLTENQETETAELTLTWQVLHPLAMDYNIFFQALTPSGEESQAYTVIAQLDTQPLQGEHPATTWQPGEILTDTYRLDLNPINRSGQSEPTGPAPAGIRYYFGFYDWRDGTRLPVDGGIDDKLIFYGN